MSEQMDLEEGALVFVLAPLPDKKRLLRVRHFGIEMLQPPMYEK